MQIDPADPLLDLRDLHVAAGNAEILRGVDLVAPPGVVALLGPNGAGKTTLIRVLTTLLRPTRGTARVCGVDIAADPVAARRLLRVTGQASTVDDTLTGRENLVLFARLLGRSRRAARLRADDLLERFGLGDAAGRLVRRYSGGMRRRLDLAAGLIDAPRVLVLDEPTTGLDPASRAVFWDVLRTLADQGTSVLLTTQLLDEAEAIADVVAVLREGRIVATGTPAELTARFGAATLRPSNAAGLVVHTAPIDGTAREVARALNGLEPDRLDLRVDLDRPTLEDAFAAITATTTGTRA